jgi:Big-like domain-containing protein
MTTLQIAYSAAASAVQVQTLGDTLAGGYTKIGEIPRTSVADPLGQLPAGFQSGHDKQSVLFHHVRKALYSVGVLDTSRVPITVDTTYTAETGMTISPATATKAHGATQQITPTFTPTTPSDTRVIYTTSDATKATVDANGLVTTIAAGTVTITATSDEGDFTGTCVITIT